METGTPTQPIRWPQKPRAFGKQAHSVLEEWPKIQFLDNWKQDSLPPSPETAKSPHLPYFIFPTNQDNNTCCKAYGISVTIKRALGPCTNCQLAASRLPVAAEPFPVLPPDHSSIGFTPQFLTSLLSPLGITLHLACHV